MRWDWFGLGSLWAQRQLTGGVSLFRGGKCEPLSYDGADLVFRGHLPAGQIRSFKSCENGHLSLVDSGTLHVIIPQKFETEWPLNSVTANSQSLQWRRVFSPGLLLEPRLRWDTAGLLTSGVKNFPPPRSRGLIPGCTLGISMQTAGHSERSHGYLAENLEVQPVARSSTSNSSLWPLPTVSITPATISNRSTVRKCWKWQSSCFDGAPFLANGIDESYVRWHIIFPVTTPPTCVWPVKIHLMWSSGGWKCSVI